MSFTGLECMADGCVTVMHTWKTCSCGQPLVYCDRHGGELACNKALATHAVIHHRPLPTAARVIRGKK